MANVKIGVDLGSLRLPLRRALPVAAQVGADAVEIDAGGEIRPHETSRTAIREIRKLLEDRRLRVAAMSFRTRAGYGSPDGLESRLEAAKAAMRLAYSLGTSIVVVNVGLVPADDKSDSWRILVDVLGDLGRYGQHAGAMLAAETGHESPELLAKLLAALPEQSLGLDLNPGRLLANALSPAEMVTRLGRSILHVHATDAVRDLAGARADLIAPGRGAADYPTLLGTLEEHGYRGYVTVQAQSAESPEEELAESIRYLRRL